LRPLWSDATGKLKIQSWQQGAGSTPATGTRKSPTQKRRTFSTKSTLTGGINRHTPMKSTDVDEIRLDGGWVDLISP